MYISRKMFAVLSRSREIIGDLKIVINLPYLLK